MTTSGVMWNQRHRFGRLRGMQLQTPPEVDAATHESRVRVRMTWPAFEAFLASRGDDGATRITYLDGVLEIRSPSSNHELIKKNLARLLELWAFEFDVSLTGVGSFTIVNEDEGACAPRRAAGSRHRGRVVVAAAGQARELPASARSGSGKRAW